MRLKHFLSVFLTLLTLSVGQMWGANPTITLTQSALELTGSYSNKAEKVIDGVTFCHTDLMKSNDNIQVKASSGVLYNKTAIPGNITKIIVTHSGTARPTTVYYGTASQPSDSEKSSSFSGSRTVNVSGSNSYFKITRGSNAAYWTKVEIEYAPTPSDPYSVTLMDDNTVLTEDPAGSGVTLPSRAGCTGYTFAGWTKTWVAPQSSWTTTAPTIIPAGSYTPTNNENLYPVYTKTEGGSGFSSYTKVTSTPDDWSGQYILSTGSYTATGAMANNTYLTRDTYTAFTTEATSREFTLAKVGSTGYYIKFGNNYLGYDTSTKFKTTTTAPTTSSTAYLWTPSISGITNVGTNTRTIADNGSSDFRPYSSPSSGIVYLYKRIEGGSTTYYISVPNCCTALGQINGSVLRTHF